MAIWRIVFQVFIFLNVECWMLNFEFLGRIPPRHHQGQASQNLPAHRHQRLTTTRASAVIIQPSSVATRRWLMLTSLLRCRRRCTTIWQCYNYTLSNTYRKKEKALKTILFSKLFPFFWFFRITCKSFVYSVVWSDCRWGVPWSWRQERRGCRHHVLHRQYLPFHSGRFWGVSPLGSYAFSRRLSATFRLHLRLADYAGFAFRLYHSASEKEEEPQTSSEISSSCLPTECLPR